MLSMASALFAGVGGMALGASATVSLADGIVTGIARE
jgi:hypothetical protein